MSLPYDEIREALKGERLPAAFVDLDALDRNLDTHLDILKGRGTPIRVASKSVRCVAVLKRLMKRGGTQLRGLMCFSVEEAAFLSTHGFDDLLVAYPPWQQSDLEIAARLSAEGKIISFAVDSAEAAVRAGAVGQRFGVQLKLVICVDMSLKALGGTVHLGVRRSPLHSKEDVLALATRIVATTGVELQGLLCYEAQIAGLQDANPYDRLMNPPKALVKQLSIREVQTRRMEIVDHLKRHDIALPVVNGGGTGSLDTTTTATGVTEITAGSGFYKPHLFDYYRAPHMQRLEPAAFFAIEVTRKPNADMVTCLGGGYVASGPPGWDKIPKPWLPSGLALTKDEGCGEVQTPFTVAPGTRIGLGDPVIMRHAKAGELMERFKELLFIQGGCIVERVPTYRGEGQCFF